MKKVALENRRAEQVSLSGFWKIAKKLGIDLYEIGFVTRGKHVIFENGHTQLRITDVGWLHFQ